MSWWNGQQVSQPLDAVLHKGQMMPEKNRFPAVLVSCSPATAESANAAVNLFATSAESITQTANAPDLAKTTSTTTRNETGFCTQVRRITPLEAERLQGFPDNYTQIGGSKDSPRYKALGNRMAVPVMRWIGFQIDFAHNHF